MQPTRVIIRSPYLCGRIAKAPSTVRGMSLLSPFGPRLPTHVFPTFADEFAPLFRLMDDMSMAVPRFDHFLQPRSRPNRSFEPRFNVREVEDAYELRGELPDVGTGDLEVHFTDAQTLVVRGRKEEATTHGTPPAIPAALEIDQAAIANAVVDNSDAASTHSAASYQKPTVEDENAVVNESTSTPDQVTPAESIASESHVNASTSTPVEEKQQKSQTPQNTPQHWMSKRSTSSFQRTFTFPTRVDQDAVKASLKNGVLTVVVPKAVAPKARRIIIE